MKKNKDTSKNISSNPLKDNLTVLLASLLVSLTALLFIYADTLKYRTPELPVYLGATSPIESWQTYRQEFTCQRDGLSKIGVMCTALAEEDAGILTVILEDEEGQEIQRWNTDATDLPNNNYLNLKLHERIEDSSGKTYRLVINSEESGGSQAVIFTTNYRDSTGLFMNDDDWNCILCYTLEYEQPAAALLNTRIILITLFALIAFPLLMKAATLIFPVRRIWLLTVPELIAIAGCNRLLRHTWFSDFTQESKAVNFFLLCALWTAAAIVLYRLIYVRKVKLHVLAAIILPIMSILTTAFITPGAGHDEVHHYSFANEYANILMFKDDMSALFNEEEGETIMLRSEDADFMSWLDTELNEDKLWYIVDNFELKSTDDDLQEYKLANITEFSTLGSVNAPLGYIVPGLGVVAGRLLHLGAMPTFYLGRLFNAALFIVIVCLAIKIIPVGKETLFVISMFPMLLQQIATYSYDSTTLAITFLFTAITVSVFYEDKRMSLKQFIVLIILALILASCKIVYAPLALILLAVPANKLCFKKDVLVRRCYIAAIAVAGVAAVIFLIRTPSLMKFLTPVFLKEDDSALIITDRIVDMLHVTIFNKGSHYLEGLIAYPGSYEFHAPMNVIVIYVVLFVFSLFRTDDEHDMIGNGTRILGAVLITVSFILIELTMASKLHEVLRINDRRSSGQILPAVRSAYRSGHEVFTHTYRQERV